MPATAENPKPLTIVSLTAENFKRLTAIHIAPDGSFVEITGRNAQGKSSVLDSIMAALGGERYVPEKALRDGADKGFVELDLGELVVRRTFTMAGGGTLKVTRKDGSIPKGGAQSILNELIGRIGFDPAAFMALPPAKQADHLRQAIGIDFTALDEQRAGAYEARREANAIAKSSRTRLAGLGAAPPEVERVDVSALSDHISTLQAALTDHQGAARAVADAEGLYNVAAGEVERLEQALERTRKHAGAMLDALEASKAAAKGFPKPDLEELELARRKMSEADTTNAAAQRFATWSRDRDRLTSEAEEAEAQAAKHDAKLAEVDAAKADAIAKAPLPVKGLGFGADGITLNSIPLEQASSAEQIKVATAIACALNPTIRVVLIRAGSLLDPQSVKAVAEQVAAAGGQLWIERVTGGEPVGIVIEDGAVKA